MDPITTPTLGRSHITSRRRTDDRADDNRQTGDILVDVDDMSWEDLQQTAANGDAWRVKVNVSRQAAQQVTIKRKKRQVVRGGTQINHTKTRFTFHAPSHIDNNEDKQKGTAQEIG